MVSHSTWIVFAHLVMFTPEGNQNNIQMFKMEEFVNQKACYEYLGKNYDFVDGSLQIHAVKKSARVLLLGCGELKTLQKTQAIYELENKRGIDT